MTTQIMPDQETMTKTGYTKATKRVTDRNLSPGDKIQQLIEREGNHWIWCGAFESNHVPTIYSADKDGNDPRNRSVRRLVWKLYREDPADPDTILDDNQNVVSKCGDYRCVAPACLSRIARKSVVQRAKRYANMPVKPEREKRRTTTLTDFIRELGGTSEVEARYQQLLERALEIMSPSFGAVYTASKTLMRQWFGQAAQDKTLFRALTLDMALNMYELMEAKSNTEA